MLRLQRPCSLVAVLLGLCAALPAVDPEPPVQPWSWKVRLGVFMQNVASTGAEESRDPTIASSTDSSSYTIKGEFQPVWESGGNRLEQRIETEYGQLRTDDCQGWVENSDRLAYGVTYERSLGRPYLLYGNGSALTVYTGAEPDSEAFDPFIAKLSTGWGLRQTGLLPIEDSWVCRIGWFVSKRWEHDAPWYQTRTRTGPELQIPYERKQSEDVGYFIQQDAFGDASDPRHAALRGQAGLRVAVAKRISVEFGVRAYYESEPEEAGGDPLGYDSWSLRQEALVGLVWEDASLVAER
jgi:hypothetical protein